MVKDCMLAGTKTTFSVRPAGGAPLTYFVHTELTQCLSLVDAGECGSRKKTCPYARGASAKRERTRTAPDERRGASRSCCRSSRGRRHRDGRRRGSRCPSSSTTRRRPNPGRRTWTWRCRAGCRRPRLPRTRRRLLARARRRTAAARRPCSRRRGRSCRTRRGGTPPCRPGAGSGTPVP